jgi:hypothetical protein
MASASAIPDQVHPVPGAATPFSCPMPICSRGTWGQRWHGTTKSQMLEHLRAKHAHGGLPSFTLSSIGTVYCPHLVCVPLNHQQQPQLPASVAMSTPFTNSPSCNPYSPYGALHPQHPIECLKAMSYSVLLSLARNRLCLALDNSSPFSSTPACILPPHTRSH